MNTKRTARLLESTAADIRFEWLNKLAIAAAERSRIADERGRDWRNQVLSEGTDA